MLAEIFFLQLEATLRANNEESARSQIRGLRFNYRARLKEAPHHIAAQPSVGRAVTWAINPHVGFLSLSILHSNLRRLKRLFSLPWRKHNQF